MSNERISANEAAAAQEFPDRVGFKPDNPFLANFRPYIPANVRLRELTPLPLIMGTLLGIIFGASSLYLVLKTGLTVSASIPVAVISLALFRLWSKIGGRDATILENNIVQTAGSAGESLAFGVPSGQADRDPGDTCSEAADDRTQTVDDGIGPVRAKSSRLSGWSIRLSPSWTTSTRRCAWQRSMSSMRLVLRREGVLRRVEPVDAGVERTSLCPTRRTSTTAANTTVIS